MLDVDDFVFLGVGKFMQDFCDMFLVTDAHLCPAARILGIARLDGAQARGSPIMFAGP